MEPIKNRRTVYRFEKEKWIKIEFEDLKKDDIFRMFDGNEIVMTDRGNYIYRATGEPKRLGKIYKIDCEEISYRIFEIDLYKKAIINESKPIEFPIYINHDCSVPPIGKIIFQNKVISQKPIILEPVYLANSDEIEILEFSIIQKDESEVNK